MKKITFYLSLIYLLTNAKAFAQTSYQKTDKFNLGETKISQKQISGAYYLPVYYNFERRQLFYNGSEKISGKDFLEICRSINDSLIQIQLDRYDEYTRKKIALTVGAIVLGCTAYATLLGSAVATDQENPSMQISLVVCGLTSLIATPICAIGTSSPHHKRKEILFRDLPIAYNNFVESKNNVQPIVNK